MYLKAYQYLSVSEKNFPNIRHNYDMWHGAKNLGKKLAAVSNSEKLCNLHEILIIYCRINDDIL